MTQLPACLGTLPGGAGGGAGPRALSQLLPRGPVRPPGRDAGEVGGGGGAAPIFWGAVRRLGIFWKVAPAGARPGGAAGAGGVGWG